MKKELRRHKLAYTILALTLVVIAAAFLLVWPNHSYQRFLALLLSVFYFLWGVITHVKSDHITGRIVLEYLLISLLAGLILGIITL